MRAPHSRTLYELIVEQAARDPRREALVVAGDRLTYGDLAAGAGRVARALQMLGVRRGDRVGLLANNRREWLDVCLGAAALGAPLVAFNTWAKEHDLEFLLAHSRVEVLITLDRLGTQDFLASLRALLPELWSAEPGAWRSVRFPHLREVVVLGGLHPPGARPFAAWRAAAGPLEPLAPGDGASAGDVALVVYTSGSTARPKAVPLLHHATIENGFNIGERQGLRPDDRVLVASPLFWSFGSANAAMATFSHGATLVLQEQFEPARALELIEGERCTAIYTLPVMTHALVEQPTFDPRRTRTLRTGVTIGSPEDVRLAAEVLGAAGICNVYGLTETYGNCCVTAATLPLETRLTCQGAPLPGMTLRIVDPDTRAVLPPGSVGEVEVGGFVTRAYLDAPEENAASFCADGFFRTGDMGSLGEDGLFRFFARAKEMIKTSGINVSPLEVEEFLATHPAVAQAAVVGAPDPVRGEVVVAFVILRDGASATADELREYCRSRIAGYKAPARVVVCASFPQTTTGKLARKTLKEWAVEARHTPTVGGKR